MAESAAFPPFQAPLNLLLKLAPWYQQLCLPPSKSRGEGGEGRRGVRGRRC